MLASFLSQFYDDKPCPRLILLSHDSDECDLLAEALSIKSGRKVEILVPRRGEKKELVDHAAANAREALGRKLAETVSQQRLLAALGGDLRPAAAAAPHRGLRQQPHPGHEPGRRDDRRGAGGVPEEPVSQVQHPFGRSSRPGDDYGMMREVLTRRFKRLLAEAPRAAADAADEAHGSPSTLPLRERRSEIARSASRP